MDASLETEFENIKCLLDRISWPLSVVGIWPKNMTTTSRLKSSIFLAYFVIHLSLEFLDLASVAGNLELMLANLMETGFQTMAMCRILIMRFNKTLRCIINSIDDYLVIENFRDPEELKIYLRCATTGEKFYQVGAAMMAGTALMYYITPLQTYLVTRLTSGNATLTNPYRIYHFVNISPIERTAVLYVCQFPMIYTAIAYVTSSGILLGFASNYGGQIAILTHRISSVRDDNSDSREVFLTHTQQHIRILLETQWLNRTFHSALLLDLIVTTVLIGLISYNFLMNIDEADTLGIFQLGSYVATMIWIVYVDCFIGEYLNTACTDLLSAYYEGNWYEMSLAYKKSLIICMEASQEPIRLTAGKFYVFSLEGFTKLMKSSMVYVSMLRTIM